jgi:hypothetical protein
MALISSSDLPLDRITSVVILSLWDEKRNEKYTKKRKQGHRTHHNPRLTTQHAHKASKYE